MSAELVPLRELMPNVLIPDDATVTRKDADALQRDILLYGDAFVEPATEGLATHRRISPEDVHAD